MALQVSPAGSARLRPQVTKTLLKGAILVAVFSLFLDINPSTFVNYLVFLGLSVAVISIFALAKRSSSFELGEDEIVVRRFLSKEKRILYPDIVDLSIAQGVLAKRFGCGSVFLVLKSGKGNTRIMGGGTAEKLDDVPDPDAVRGFVVERLSPFPGPSELGA